MDAPQKEIAVAAFNLLVRNELAKNKLETLSLTIDRRRIQKAVSNLASFGIIATPNDNTLVFSGSHDLSRLISELFPNLEAPRFDEPRGADTQRKILEHFFQHSRYERYFDATQISYTQLAYIYMNRSQYMCRGDMNHLVTIPKTYVESALENLKRNGKLHNVVKDPQGLHGYIQERGIKNAMLLGDFVGEVDQGQLEDMRNLVKRHMFNLDDIDVYRRSRPVVHARWITNVERNFESIQEEYLKSKERFEVAQQIMQAGGEKLAIEYLMTLD